MLCSLTLLAGSKVSEKECESEHSILSVNKSEKRRPDRKFLQRPVWETKVAGLGLQLCIYSKKLSQDLHRLYAQTSPSVLILIFSIHKSNHSRKYDAFVRTRGLGSHQIYYVHLNRSIVNGYFIWVSYEDTRLCLKLEDRISNIKNIK